jgi:hypothetical protein
MSAKRFFIGVEKVRQKIIICLLEILGRRIIYFADYQVMAAKIKELCSPQDLTRDDIRNHLDKNCAEKRCDCFDLDFLVISGGAEHPIAVIVGCPEDNQLPFLPKTFFVYERDFTFKLSEVPHSLKKYENLVLLELAEPQLSLAREQINAAIKPKPKLC